MFISKSVVSESQEFESRPGLKRYLGTKLAYSIPEKKLTCKLTEKRCMEGA